MGKYDWMKPHHRPKTKSAPSADSGTPKTSTVLADTIESMTVVEVLKAVDEGVYDLNKVLAVEMARKNRSTLIQQLNDRRA